MSTVLHAGSGTWATARARHPEARRRRSVDAAAARRARRRAGGGGEGHAHGVVSSRVVALVGSDEAMKISAQSLIGVILVWEKLEPVVDELKSDLRMPPSDWLSGISS